MILSKPEGIPRKKKYCKKRLFQSDNPILPLCRTFVKKDGDNVLFYLVRSMSQGENSCVYAVFFVERTGYATKQPLYIPFY